MLGESTKGGGDFGSGEVGPRLEDVKWGCTADRTQREVLPEGSHSTDRME